MFTLNAMVYWHLNIVTIFYNARVCLQHGHRILCQIDVFIAVVSHNWTQNRICTYSEKNCHFSYFIELKLLNIISSCITDERWVARSLELALMYDLAFTPLPCLHTKCCTHAPWALPIFLKWFMPWVLCGCSIWLQSLTNIAQRLTLLEFCHTSLSATLWYAPIASDDIVYLSIIRVAVAVGLRLCFEELVLLVSSKSLNLGR